MDTEKFLDWLAELDIAHYKATKEGDYDPKCNSHFYLKGSQERFTSKEMIEIFSNNASDKTNGKYKNSSDMEDEIFDIVTDLIRDDITKDEAIDKLLILYNVRLSLFQKNRLDLLNWAKSELKQETNTKLGKTMTPYRSDKIIFLRRIIDWLNNEA